MQLNSKKAIQLKMDIFFQRSHPDDQQIHEKVLNITNRQGNGN